MKPILLFILLCYFSANCFAQDYPKLNLKPSKIYYATIKTIPSYLVNGFRPEHLRVTTFKLSFRVIDLCDTAFNMEVKYDSIRIVDYNTNPKRHLEDSTVLTSDIKTEPINITNQRGKMVTAMMHRPFEVLLSKNGKVISVNNYENIFANLPNKGNLITTDLSGNFRYDLLIRDFNTNNLKETIELFTLVFPESRVTKNDRWAVTKKMIRYADVKSIYSLPHINKNSYKIHADTKLKADTQKKFHTYVSGGLVRGSTTVTSSGDFEIDKTSGWITKGEFIEKTNSTGEYKDGPLGNQTMHVIGLSKISIINK